MFEMRSRWFKQNANQVDRTDRQVIRENRPCLDVFDLDHLIKNSPEDLLKVSNLLERGGLTSVEEHWVLVGLGVNSPFSHDCKFCLSHS
jgi:hypothetical protein